MKHSIFFISLMLLTDLSAQQSSKSKSKDRFRERSGGSAVLIRNVGNVNQNGADYAPVFFKQGIVFLSARDKTQAELYYAFNNTDGMPAFPQKVTFSGKKKTGTTDGPIAFSRDAKTAFLTLSQSGKDGKTMMKIAVSRYGRPDWTQPEILTFNSETYSCMHPCLSPDGKRLFFSSDMPGGAGGYDIYVAERQGAGWGTPMNLGPVVNTEKQEIFPFINPDGTLFFSSNGHSHGLGGFDNYYASVASGNPEEVINLGDLYNSSADDMSFIINDDGKSGFFTSSRPGGRGNVDIYQFEMTRSLAPGNSVRLSVSDATTGQIVPGAEIRLLELSADGLIVNRPDAYTPFLQAIDGQSGVFRLVAARKEAAALGRPDNYSNAAGEARIALNAGQRYLVLISAPGYQASEKTLESGASSTLDFRLSPQVVETAPPSQDLPAGTLLLLDALFADPGEALLLPNAPTSLKALHDLLAAHPGRRITISAHNQSPIDNTLADQRIKIIKDYLVLLGTEAGRIDLANTDAPEPRSRSREGVVVWF